MQSDVKAMVERPHRQARADPADLMQDHDATMLVLLDPRLHPTRAVVARQFCERTAQSPVIGTDYRIVPGTAHLITNRSATDCRFLLLQGVGKYDWIKVED